jgi:cytochrome c oxidase subunit 1
MRATRAVSAPVHRALPGFWSRWFFSTNHKDIGTLYLLFSIGAGLISGAISVLMRIELMTPGGHLLHGNHQLYNVLITAHGLSFWLLVVAFALLVGSIFVGDGVGTGWTLEWTVSSPPPFHTFNELPVIK